MAGPRAPRPASTQKTKLARQSFLNATGPALKPRSAKAPASPEPMKLPRAQHGPIVQPRTKASPGNTRPKRL